MKYRTFKLRDVPRDTLKRAVVAGRPLCLAHLSDGVVAVDDMCTNLRASLAAGAILRDALLECPRNGCTYDLRTGEARGLPAVLPLAAYPVTIEGDTIVVELPSP